tara:strand:- start:225 stop:437 length:213 start_codon:yes stop_codon:yes gene_type:complete
MNKEFDGIYYRPLYSYKGVMEAIDIRKDFLRNLIRLGKLERVRDGGKVWITGTSLKKYVDGIAITNDYNA